MDFVPISAAAPGKGVHFQWCQAVTRPDLRHIAVLSVVGADMTRCVSQPKKVFLRDPVKSSFRGRDKLAHAVSIEVPLQKTLYSLHKEAGTDLHLTVMCAPTLLLNDCSDRPASDIFLLKAIISAACWHAAEEASAHLLTSSAVLPRHY